MELLEDQVAAIRSFNRFYTPLIGLLEEGLVETPFNLSESRVLFELAVRPEVDARALRADLGLEPGHLARILARFVADGLATREVATEGGRREIIRMSSAGWDAFCTLDRRMARRIRSLLAPLRADDRSRLLDALETVCEVLGGATELRIAGLITLRSPRPGELGWVIARHGAVYAREYGWNAEFEGLVASIVAGFAERNDTARERVWIADRDGEPVGCVFCARRDETTAQLRCLLVEPSARGFGVGRRLVDECVAFARAARYRSVVLWTNDVLVDARRLYERAGFQLAHQAPIRAFGHDLVEQTWSLDLT